MEVAHKYVALNELHTAFIFFLKPYSYSGNPDLIAYGAAPQKYPKPTNENKKPTAKPSRKVTTAAHSG